jgi:hypothetical protein
VNLVTGAGFTVDRVEITGGITRGRKDHCLKYLLPARVQEFYARQYLSRGIKKKQGLPSCGNNYRGRRRKNMIQIVTVVNNHRLFNDTIGANRFMNVHPVHVYDNTRENIGIARRYNDFLRSQMPSDAWIVFCHQDFAFQEDVTDKIVGLDRKVIYGPTGTGPTKQLVFVAALSRFGVERFRFGLYDRSKKFGQIVQRTEQKTQKMGQFLRTPAMVDTVDCCCLIVHTDLIRRYGITFDEQLDWHLYAEDFCLYARDRYQVATKAVQLSCVHLSGGTTDAKFDAALLYLKQKYKTSYFSTTCYDGYRRF